MARKITVKELDTTRFIEEKTRMIKDTVGDGIAINALSGGVDSSVVTMLGHRALGDKLGRFYSEWTDEEESLKR